MTAILFWAGLVTVAGWWGARESERYRLVCPSCGWGFESPVPQGVCGRCGHTVTTGENHRR